MWKGSEVALTQMKGITCCGDCGYYNWKKHKCARATDEGDARSNFYADCPLPDVVPAQEPRVMTLEELLALKKNTPVYVECISGACGWDVFAGIDYSNGYDCVITGAPWAVKEYWRQSLYNVSWRCWTSEPSAQRRESVEWD